MVATAMDHAMSGSHDADTALVAFQPVKECRNKVVNSCTRIEPHEVVLRHRTAFAIARREDRSVSDPRNLAAQDRRWRASLDRIDRELEARRTRIQDKDGVRHSTTFVLLLIKSCANAQEASRDIGLSARLVRMIGTRAPSTMPAASAPAK